MPITVIETTTIKDNQCTLVGGATFIQFVVI